MRKLFPVLVLMSFSLACSHNGPGIQNSDQQKRWPGSDQTAKNQKSTNTETGPNTPASKSADQNDNHTENLTKPATPTPTPQATPQRQATPKPQSKTSKKSEAGAIQPQRDRYRFQRFPWTGKHYLRINTPAVLTSRAAMRA
jgi:hypothetical protein